MLRNEEDGTERGSLLWLLDHSATAAGGRLLRSWVAHPLTDATAINERLDAVEELSTVQPEEPGTVHALDLAYYHLMNPPAGTS